MGVVADIGRTWMRGPRDVVRAHLAQGPQEARALAFLMLGCALAFLAQWPRLAREAHLEGAEFERLLAYALVGWLMAWPLLFYLAAWIGHGVSRALGGRGSSGDARMALFWSWLAASPMGLLTGALAGLTGASLATNAAGVAWIAVVAGFWWRAQRAAALGSDVASDVGPDGHAA